MKLPKIFLISFILLCLSLSLQSKNRLDVKAAVALNYCKKNHFTTDFCILVDMQIHSGRARFFVFSFSLNKILKSGLVSHGCGNQRWAATATKDKPVFSSINGSHCTALGKYKIGKRGVSQWGIGVNYLMHGLEKSNKNAVAREIVLHSWDAVLDTEQFPEGTPEGWGCPAVSNTMMTYVDFKLKAAKKPVLLWIYY